MFSVCIYQIVHLIYVIGLHNDNKHDIMLSGFNEPIRKDRTGRRGGGCIMYAKQGLMLREENIVGSEDTESVWATLLSGNGPNTTIGQCYVPPNDRELYVKLHRIYREVCKDNKQCVIIGDFNHRTIDWDIPRAEHADQEFLEAVQDCYLTQHVREPTRGENILDLILSTEEHMIEDTMHDPTTPLKQRPQRHQLQYYSGRKTVRKQYDKDCGLQQSRL